MTTFVDMVQGWGHRRSLPARPGSGLPAATVVFWEHAILVAVTLPLLVKLNPT